MNAQAYNRFQSAYATAMALHAAEQGHRPKLPRVIRDDEGHRTDTSKTIREKLRADLREHPGATLREVSERTGIGQRQLSNASVSLRNAGEARVEWCGGNVHKWSLT